MLPDFRLYLITDRKMHPEIPLPDAVKMALSGGVRAVQLREKDMSETDLLKSARSLRKVTDRYRGKLFINDRFDIAIATGADGVHLTQSSIPVDAVRQCIKDRLMIGVSTHSLDEAIEAEDGGADFITLGPVFPTPSKMKYGDPVGIDTLKKVCKRVRIPVFAIGGIKAGRIREVMDAGAYGVAMISEIFGSSDIKHRAEEIVKITEGRGSKSPESHDDL
jgi:thiamine-phosphate pyrophosphorylase